MSSTTLPIHPRTGLRALGVTPKGRIVWPILGGSEPPAATVVIPTGVGGDGDDDGDDDGDAGSQQHQPPEFTPITSQEDLDRLLTKRVRQVERRYKDYDAIRAKAEQYDQLAAASQTDQERAVAEAERAGLARAVPKVVRAEFKAQATAAGLSREQLNVLLEDMDLTRYATEDGDPDEDKIARKIKALAPPQRATGADFGQGRRGRQAEVADMSSAIRKLAGR